MLPEDEDEVHRERSGLVGGGPGGEVCPEEELDGPAWHGLERRLRSLQAEHGHGHPEALEVEERLARALAEADRPDEAREAFEEVLTYRAVLDGEHAECTATVARDLFALVQAQDDRPAMAEVYYRFLSWIPMRDPASLTPTLRQVLTEVELLLAQGA